MKEKRTSGGVTLSASLRSWLRSLRNIPLLGVEIFTSDWLYSIFRLFHTSYLPAIVAYKKIRIELCPIRLLILFLQRQPIGNENSSGFVRLFILGVAGVGERCDEAADESAEYGSDVSLAEHANTALLHCEQPL